MLQLAVLDSSTNLNAASYQIRSYKCANYLVVTNEFKRKKRYTKAKKSIEARVKVVVGKDN